jgi:hypothetical protein
VTTCEQTLKKKKKERDREEDFAVAREEGGEKELILFYMCFATVLLIFAGASCLIVDVVLISIPLVECRACEATVVQSVSVSLPARGGPASNHRRKLHHYREGGV